MSHSNPYAVAFRVGLVGSILLMLSALSWPVLDVLALLTGWGLATLLILPWLIVSIKRRGLELPAWCYAFRGPHQ